MNKYDKYNISLQFADELLQRVLCDEASIKDAVDILVNANMCLTYRSMLKEEIDEALLKHSDYIEKLIHMTKEYTKQNKVTNKELVLLVATAINVLLSNI